MLQCTSSSSKLNYPIPYSSLFPPPLFHPGWGIYFLLSIYIKLRFYHNHILKFHWCIYLIFIFTVPSSFSSNFFLCHFFCFWLHFWCWFLFHPWFCIHHFSTCDYACVCVFLFLLLFIPSYASTNNLASILGIYEIMLDQTQFYH